MRFQVQHRSHYQYAVPAWESHMEARLTPFHHERQRVHRRELRIEPTAAVDRFTDYFGNAVEYFAIPHRHQELLLVAEAEVETRPPGPPGPAHEVTISEARQLYRSDPLRHFEYLAESEAIALTASVHREANRLFRPADPIGTAVRRLLEWIHTEFRYRPGSTKIDTPVDEVLKRREGVCQDFAQIMIAVLRSAEIPARYVCGYIETESERAAAAGGATGPGLVGASESHAWVEVCLPGAHWWALDPTNRIEAGERHVAVAVGRDYLDTAPTRGVFKGSSRQALTVAVRMRRLN